MLGFYLTAVDSKYHELKVSVARPGVTLNYRRGYYALDEPKIDTAQKKSDLSSALLNPVDSGAVGIVATLDMQPGSPRNTANVRLRLDPDTLSLDKNGAGWTGKVEEMFVELNSAGREVGRISASKAFDVTPTTRDSYEVNGVALLQSFQLAPDAVKLAIIVRDSASGRTGTLSVALNAVTPSSARQ